MTFPKTPTPVTVVMTDYKVLPVQGGGICLLGMVAGRETQSTNIKRVSEHQVQTESGTIYQLKDMKPGVWVMQLQSRRPNQYEILVKNKIV